MSDSTEAKHCMNLHFLKSIAAALDDLVDGENCSGLWKVCGAVFGSWNKHSMGIDGVGGVLYSAHCCLSIL